MESTTEPITIHGMDASFTCGALFRGTIRDELSRMVFMAPRRVKIKWYETKGLLDSRFNVSIEAKRQADVDDWTEVLTDYLDQWRR